MNCAQRFWAKVDDRAGPDACWPWLGGRYPSGYGSFYEGGRSVSAHRVAYELASGEPIGELQVGHHCHRKGCVNPAHLFAGSRSQIQANRRGAQTNNACGVRGVYWWAARRRWVAHAKHHGRTHYAGAYRTLAEADAAARAKRLELFTDNDSDRVAEAFRES